MTKILKIWIGDKWGYGEATGKTTTKYSQKELKQKYDEQYKEDLDLKEQGDTMKKTKKTQSKREAELKDIIPEYVTLVKVKPGNWLARIIWKFIQVRFEKEQIKNPIHTSINQEANTFGLLPKVKFIVKLKTLKDLSYGLNRIPNSHAVPKELRQEAIKHIKSLIKDIHDINNVIKELNLQFDEEVKPRFIDYRAFCANKTEKERNFREQIIKIGSQIHWITNFFNITEEDLK